MATADIQYGGYEMKVDSPDVNEHDMRKARPVLSGNFFDMRIRNGRWLAIGKQETPKVPFPFFKIKTNASFASKAGTDSRCAKRHPMSAHFTILQE
jgi:hypothetical protein